MANKITNQDLANVGVIGMPDVPGLTTEEMQRKLEETAREVIIPRLNEVIEEVDEIGDDYVKRNGNAGYTYEMAMGDRNFITKAEYGNMPPIPAVSNYVYIIGKDSSGVVKSAIAIGVDYTNQVFKYSGCDNKWDTLTTSSDLADTNAYLEGKLKEKATLGDANAYFAGILLGNTPNTNAYIYNDGNDGILFKFADINGQAQYVNIIDLLNNIHTTNAAYTMAQTKLSNQMTTLANGTDMDSITDIGFYTGSDLVNAPVGGWVVFIHMRVNNDPNYCIQILVSNGYTKMFFRLQNGGNWEKWYELSRTMDLSNYLPLSGGTTTGKVLCNSCSKTNAAQEAYAGGAFEIREVEQVGSYQTDISYAPKLGFHWAGTAGAAIALGSDGRFYSLSTNFGQNVMLDSSMFTVDGDDLILEFL